MAQVKLTGGNEVLQNLNRAIRQIEGRTRAGLLKAGLFGKAEALKQTPIDTGHLRGSAYVELLPTKEPVVEIGYTADYAPFVHEIQKNYKVGNWQFLRNALVENKEKILEIIKDEAEV